MIASNPPFYSLLLGYVSRCPPVDLEMKAFLKWLWLCRCYCVEHTVYSFTKRPTRTHNAQLLHRESGAGPGMAMNLPSGLSLFSPVLSAAQLVAAHLQPTTCSDLLHLQTIPSLILFPLKHTTPSPLFLKKIKLIQER